MVFSRLLSGCFVVVCAHVYSIAGICARIPISTLDPLHEQIILWVHCCKFFFAKLGLEFVLVCCGAVLSLCVPMFNK